MLRWCSCWRMSGRWYGTIVIPARAIARLYSTEAQRGSTPARRINEPVMQSRVCSHWLLLTSNPLSSLCSEQAPPVACRTSVLVPGGRRSCTALGIRTRLRSHITLFAEKGSCVGSCLSSCRASYSSEISPTDSQPCPYQYRVPRTRCFVSFRRCTR